MNILFEPKNHFHFGLHQPMIDHPPSGVIYTPGHLDFFFQKEMHSAYGSNMSKSVLMMGSMMGTGDIIFSPHTLITNSIPWIIDIDHVDWLFMNDYMDVTDEEFIPQWKINIAKKLLKSPWCRQILCRSKTAQKSIQALFHDQEISNKCTLFYPAQPLRPFLQNRNQGITLGFIISSYANYYRKGGDVALSVYLKLKKKYPTLQLIYVGALPPKKLFFNPSSIPGLIHYNNMSHNKLIHSILPQINILLMPSRAETFGMTALESMSYGIPVVANVGKHVYSIHEVIVDGKTGLTVPLLPDNKPIHANAEKINVIEFIHKTESLIVNSKLRFTLGTNAQKLFRDKLSINTMNSILMRIIDQVKRQ